MRTPDDDSRRRTITVADNRARVPFALIGVLLLASSIAIVTTFNSRTQPEQPQVSVGAAVDRSLASSQTVLRTASKQALDTAAQEPLTSVDTSTAVGRALAPDEAVDRSEREWGRLLFKRYAELRVYLRASEMLAAANQTVGKETTTEVTLPPVSNDQESVEAALRNITIVTGRERPSDSLQPGQLRVRLENVTINVYRNGRVVATERATINVTVASSVFTLHSKTQQYESRLDNGSLDPGLSQEVAKLAYPTAYTKAQFERVQAPSPVQSRAFGDPVVNNDIEPMINQGLFTVQEDVFGTSDPDSGEWMAWAWTCFGARNIYTLADGVRSDDSKNDDDGNSGDSNGDGGNADGINQAYKDALSSRVSEGITDITGGGCTDAKYLFDADNTEALLRERIAEAAGFPSGEFPTTITDVIAASSGTSSTEGAGRTIEIDIEGPAKFAWKDVVGETYRPSGLSSTNDNVRDGPALPDECGDDACNFNEDVSSIINKVYKVDVEAAITNVQKEGSKPSASPPSGTGWTRDGSDVAVTTADTDVTDEELHDDGDGQRRLLHRVTVTVTNEFTETVTWKRETCTGEDDQRECEEETEETSDSSTVTYILQIEITGTHSPRTDVDKLGIDNAYTSGGGVGPAEHSPENFNEAVDESLDETLSDELLTNLDTLDTESVDSPEALRSLVSSEVTNSVTLGPEVFLTSEERSEMEAWAKASVEDIYRDINDSDSGIQIRPVETTPVEITKGEAPFGELKDRVRQNRDEIVYRDVAGQYRNVPSKLRAAVRLEYQRQVVDWIDTLQDETNERSTELKESIGPNANEKISQGQEFRDESPARMADTGGAEDRTPLDAAPLRDDITLTVDTAPTYLTLSPRNIDEVPTIRPSERGPEYRVNDELKHAPLSVKTYSPLPNPGMPIVPWPGYWYASANYWEVTLTGEYSRVEVSAKTGSPTDDAATTYVRQKQDVTVSIDGEEAVVGHVDPVSFETQVPIVVVAPGQTVFPKGSWGAGEFLANIKDDSDLSIKLTPEFIGEVDKPTDCSETWDYTGTEYKSDYAVDTCAQEPVDLSGGGDEGDG